MKASVKSVILGGIAVLSWSTVATAFKVALSHMTRFEMVFVACATALAIFTVWMMVSNSWHELKKLSKTIWARFALLGLLAPVAYYLVLFSAYDYLPAQIAQPINYIWPILLAILLAIFGHKPIPPIKYVGMAVSLLGVVFISVGGSSITGSISLLGVAMAVGSSFLWALYWIINDSLKDEVSSCTSLFLPFFFGMCYMLIGSIFFPLSNLSGEALAAGAYIGAFEMGIPFICFGIAIRTTDNPALINQMSYLAPFLSLFFISMILGESILPSTYLGLILIVGGLVFNQFLTDKLPSFKSLKH